MYSLDLLEIFSKQLLNLYSTLIKLIFLLSSKLNFSAHPSVTIAKLEIELDKIRKELLSVLSPHLISGDINKDLRAAKTQSEQQSTKMSASFKQQIDKASAVMAELQKQPDALQSFCQTSGLIVNTQKQK